METPPGALPITWPSILFTGDRLRCPLVGLFPLDECAAPPVVAYQNLGRGVFEDLDNIDRFLVAERLACRSARPAARNGITLLQYRTETKNADGITAREIGCGAWLDHNAFSTSLATYYRGAISDGYYAAVVAGFSVGNDSGSRPVGGSATWTGVMTGADLEFQNAVQGDAAVTVEAPMPAGRIDDASKPTSRLRRRWRVPEKADKAPTPSSEVEEPGR